MDNLKGEYLIGILPDEEETIEKDSNPSKVDGGRWRINGYTVINLPLKFRIRANAAAFAKRSTSNDYSPTYVVLYADENKIECVFLFRYQYTRYSKNVVPVICRCVGKRKARYHWVPVRTIVDDSKEIILSLKEDEVPFARFKFGIGFM